MFGSKLKRRERVSYHAMPCHANPPSKVVRFIGPSSSCEEYYPWIHALCPTLMKRYIFWGRGLLFPAVGKSAQIAVGPNWVSLVNSSPRCISRFPELIHPILILVKQLEGRITFNTLHQWLPPSILQLNDGQWIQHAGGRIKTCLGRRSLLSDTSHHDERSLLSHWAWFC